MLDQSFSADNFRIILDLENRKGIHVEDKLSLHRIRDINEKIKKCNEWIKIYRKANNYAKVDELQKEKKELRDKKETELKNELEKISVNIADKNYKVQLNKIEIPNSKPIYTTPITPEHYFTLKQLQRNVSKLFGVKQANRVAIVDQVKLLLADQFPKYIIRTDIQDFYESIQHTNLLDRINKDNLLTPFSKRILRGILDNYKMLSGSDKGIPRGIGISAYLAELFMRDIDNEIKYLPELTYYARYVDDIIIVFTPRPSAPNMNYLDSLKELIEVKYKITLNPEKTKSFDLRNTKSNCELEYLGYKFIFGDNPLKTKLTDKKITKYKDRLKIAFTDYQNLSKVDEKNARRLLVKRIRFLCGNTKLVNNKKNILVGIYYSNSQLTEYEDLERLDDSLRTHIATKITSPNLKERLSKYSFRNGHIEKRFSSYKTVEFTDIMKVWKTKH